MRKLSLVFALMASPVLAKAIPPVPVCPASYRQPLFISPTGEPFRAKSDDDDPVKRWFDQADRNHDGKLTAGEMMLDADRFFATLDKDGNGELLPDEVSAYEQNVAPEIRLFQGQPNPYGPDKAGKADDDHAHPREHHGKRARRATADGLIGAGRYAFLNIPNPVASADSDVNRAVDRREFARAAADRFTDLDRGQAKALTLADLPKTPAQAAANAACLAKVESKAREKKK